ncbi:hypothetical protein QBC33DRAFT_550033 [Phialemonium atrogriseum]|uniref:Heterokaryon incompatibility domain-containing protein n=1 Tax=Phialemonium atrogriseum TaxID=1093897 RepID=A0AAJ0FHH2_9PEZI|nr:uncharacterized protein QBC33DRAFT_550033 [Phialemonium atrogriseum]KAK1763393.1 hypothetical protein QBC33DRAFT_550033 [Phialemonium atrogriseum]
MADVYSSAASVVSWLGEQDSHTKPGFDVLRELKRLSEHSPNLLEKLSPGCHDYGKQLAKIFSSRESWVSVANVFQRTYFTRVWIIQEVVLAKVVKALCGSEEIEWSAITAASHFFSTTAWRDYLFTLYTESVEPQLGPRERMDIIRFRYQAPTILRSTTWECEKRKELPYQNEKRHQWAKILLYTLIRSLNFKATDPRDKIYALLGLVHDYARDKPGLLPAYELEETRSPAKAFISAAIQILEDSDDLLLLSCVEGESFQREATGRLPSWVPDWTSEESTGLRVTGYERYSASGSLKQRPTIDRQALTLGMNGIRLDHVTMVGESKQEVLQGKPFPNWLLILESLETWYGRARSEHRLDVFWRTLIVNTADYPPKLVPKTTSLGASFAKWFQEMRRVHDSSDPESEWEGLANRLSEVMDKMWEPQARGAAKLSDFTTPFSLSHHLRIFRTSEGYLGLGSECVQPGDWVWIVPASRVPLILRASHEVRSREHRHRLVGGSYLHGFMEGEGVSPTLTGKTLEEIERSMERFMLE